MYNNFRGPVYSDSSWPTYAAERERVPRKVILRKGSNGLGFNIIGGEDDEGIFVSFLLAGGAADLSGEIRRGDQLLFVNGRDLQHSSHSEAVTVLKQSGETVEIICLHQPEDYFHLESKRQLIQEQVMDVQQIPCGTLKTTQKRTFYIRTLFDYDPRHDSGLPSRGISFRHGDILQVTNASDDEWWQARKLTGDIAEDGLGIIPGRKRVERRERSRMKNVKFVGKDSESTGALTTEKKKRQLFGRRLLFTRTKDRSRSDSSVVTSEQSRVLDKGSSEEPVVSSYEAVVRQELKYIRPVIILGPLGERFMEDLVSELPEKFAISVTHTSRPKRDHEVDGQEYRFMSSRDQRDCDVQDAGLVNDHFSGTNIEAVRNIAEMGKHSLLNFSGNAVKRLQTHGFYPIVIFIKPRCIESIMEWNKRMPADEARTVFEQALKQEIDFRQYFTAILSGDAVDDLYRRAKDVIQLHSIPTAWIPSKELL